jgi:hypothetical protein
MADIIAKGVRLRFDADAVVKAVRRAMELRLQQAASYLQDQVKKAISEPSSNGPSLPGQPPHADTGRLRNSIFCQVDKNTLQAVVGTQLKYGWYLEVGFKGGGIIRPVRAQALSWIDPKTGQRVFAKWVKEGPVKARPFLRSTLLKERNNLIKILSMALTERELPNDPRA